MNPTPLLGPAAPTPTARGNRTTETPAAPAAADTPNAPGSFQRWLAQSQERTLRERQAAQRATDAARDVQAAAVRHAPPPSAPLATPDEAADATQRRLRTATEPAGGPIDPAQPLAEPASPVRANGLGASAAGDGAAPPSPGRTDPIAGAGRRAAGALAGSSGGTGSPGRTGAGVGTGLGMSAAAPGTGDAALNGRAGVAASARSTLGPISVDDTPAAGSATPAGKEGPARATVQPVSGVEASPAAGGLHTSAGDAAVSASASAASAAAGATSKAADAVPAPAAPAESVVQVPPDQPGFAAAVASQVALWVRDGVPEARLHMNPAEMGPVTVHIAMEGAMARIEFTADVAATRAALEQGLPDLAAALRNDGMTLAGGGVFDQPRGRGNDAAPDEVAAALGLPADATPAGPAVPVTAPLLRRGLLDVYA